MNENNCEIANTFLNKFFSKKILVKAFAIVLILLGLGASAGVAVATRDILLKYYENK